jgi:chromosome segregation ATPase
MARQATANQETVFSAIESIIDRGERPTLAAIRSEIGGGSLSTIAPLLREWIAVHGPVEPTPTAVEVPNQLTSALARELAGIRIEEERAARIEISGLEAQIADLTAQFSAVTTELDQTKLALTESTKEAIKYQTEAKLARGWANADRDKADALTTALAQMKEIARANGNEFARLKRGLESAEAELTAVRAQMSKERQASLDALAACHAETAKAVKEALDHANDLYEKQLESVTAAAASLAAEARADRQAATEIHAEAKALAAEAVAAVKAEMQKQIDAARSDLADMTCRHDVLQAQAIAMGERRDEMNGLRAEMAGLVPTLKDFLLTGGLQPDTAIDDETIDKVLR